MGEYKNKTYSLRLDNELMDKVRIIANKEDRPLSKQLERIVRNYIEQYEQTNGIINTKNNGNIGNNNNRNINISQGNNNGNIQITQK